MENTLDLYGLDVCANIPSITPHLEIPYTFYMLHLMTKPKSFEANIKNWLSDKLFEMEDIRFSPELFRRSHEYFTQVYPVFSGALYMTQSILTPQMLSYLLEMDGWYKLEDVDIDDENIRFVISHV